MTSSSKTWKQWVEQGFGRMGMEVARHPWRWLLGAVAATLLLAAQLVNLRMDSTIEGFLAPDSPAIQHYNAFREQFGRDEVFMVIIEVEDVFDPLFIERLRLFHAELEREVPYLDTVTSLVNARHTYGKDDELIIEELLADELPQNEVDLKRIQDYTYNNPQYQNYLISKDRHLVAVLVKLFPYITEQDEQGNTVRKNMADTQLGEADVVIRQVIARYLGPLEQGALSDDIQLSGSPAVGIALGNAVKTDFMVFTVLALFIITAVLIILFRRASGVLMPLFVMVLGLVATISSMALFDTPMQMTTSMLPSFLLAVCVGYAIHLLSIFYLHFDEGMEKGPALSEALEHSGLAIFFTSITTAAGLGSFATSELSPVASLGIYGAVGALLAFLFTVFLLPSLIMLSPIKRKPQNQAVRKSSWFDQFIHLCAQVSTTHPVRVAGIGIFLFVASLAIASQLQFSHNSLLWFPEDHPVRLALDKTEARMNGTLPVEIVINTGKAGGALEPELLKRIEASIAEVDRWQYDKVYLAKVLSVLDVIRETHRALNQNDDAFYTIPDNQELIRQELFLVEMDAADELFLLVDPSYQTLRITFFIPWLDAVEYMHFIVDLRNYFNQHYADMEQVDITGLTVILGQTFAEMLYSTGESYVLATCAISIMMILLIGGLRIGLLSMLPNLLPIALVLAILRLMGVPMDMFTLLIGSIAIGLTVDDTVHFMHGFKREYLLHGDARQAIYETLHSTGRAMLATTIVLSLGFLVYTQSVLSNLFNFGVLTALCIVFALLADFLFAPALMMIVTRRGWKI